MNIALLLEMAAEAAPDRVGLVCEGKRWTYGDLLDAARGAFQLIQESEVEYAALLDDNCEAATIAMFGAALAGVPYCPLDSRVRDQELTALLDRIAPALVIGDEERATRIAGGRGHTIYSREEFSLKAQETVPAADAREYDPGEGIAVQLFTNGTAAAPKAAILRHSKLLDYIQDTVEFGSAGEGDSALLVVPPFNSAGISAMLSSIYSLRRIVMLPKFSPDAWLHLVQAQQITDSIMESTTLARIINAMEQGVARDVSSLRAIDYGGGTMPAEVIRKALERFPGADFTNAYCLTGTSSAIALLGPEDHRMAVASGDPRVVARLGSLGKPITTVEIEIRGEDGKPVPPGEAGEIYVRGEQVSGEYMEKSNPDAEGWFSTRDAGYMDEDGYLFLCHRGEDMIVCGGETMWPGEIEEVLLTHPAVADACACAVPSIESGENVGVMIVVSEGWDRPGEFEIMEHVRRGLCLSRAPEKVVFAAELPRDGMGRLLRWKVRETLGG